MTILNIGMCYQAEVLQKNKRKPSVVNVFTSIPVEIPDAKEIPQIIGISCLSNTITEYREYNGLPIKPMLTTKMITYDENEKKYHIRNTPKEETNNISNDLKSYYHNKTNKILENNKKRFNGINLKNINENYIIINDGIPNMDLPIVCENDIVKSFSDNKSLKEKIIHKYVSELLFIDNELYHLTSGPILIKNMNKTHSFQKNYTIVDDRTYQYSDMSHTEINPLRQKKSVDMFTIDMFCDFLKAENKTNDELNNYSIYIDDIEPFINANKNILGFILFNYVFGDALRENFAISNENDISKLTEYYLNKLFTEYQYKYEYQSEEYSFSEQLKKLYDDVINSNYTYDTVQKMVKYYFSYTFRLKEEQNKIPNGMGVKNKVYPSDSSILHNNRINNMKIIENLNKIQTYRETQNTTHLGLTQ